MSEAKNHHFVPQFYLRNFSSNKKQINLFNFSREILVTSASISGQCYRRKLHAFEPGLEERLAVMEGKASEVIRSIMSLQLIPPPRTTEWFDLLTFILFQKSRTSRSIQSIETIKNFLLEHVRNGAKQGEDLSDEILKDTTPPLQIIFDILPEIAETTIDLKMHLLINDTPEQFITCDDPVVLHNMYAEGITYRGVLGWDCRGLQAFFPLSPKHLLMLYDYETYRVTGDQGLQHMTTLKEVGDVRGLNTLQALNAHENIYFLMEKSAEFENFCVKSRNKRGEGRITFVESKMTTNSDGTSGQFIHSFEPLLPVCLNPSFIKVRRSANSVPLHKRAALYRHRLPQDTHPRTGSYKYYEVDNIKRR